MLLNICFRLHGALTHPITATSTLSCCFRLLANIGIFGVNNVTGKDMKTQLEEQLHRMLPLVVVQLRSASFEVRVSSFAALEKIGAYFETCGVSELSNVIRENCSKGRRGTTIDNYEQFVTEMAKVIGTCFTNRVQFYISALQQLCTGNELRTQAEAALVLVQIVVNASEPVNDVDGVVRGLLDLCQSEHPTVRSRAVHVLGVLVATK